MPGPRPKEAITLTREQEARLPHLSTCYLAPFATGQRAQSVLLAHRQPEGQHISIAQQVGCPANTGKRWRQRGPSTDSLRDAPRAGTRHPVAPRPRAQGVALACRTPRQYGKPWQRWSSEKLAQGAVEQHLVATLAPGTIRRWLRADKMKPWRYHSWQHSTAPQFVEKAGPVLDLYAPAPARQAHGELIVWADEKPSMQARQRVTSTTAPAPGEVLQVADRSNRIGALPLFCALGVASGLTFAQPRTTKQFVEFNAFRPAVFPSTLWTGGKVLPVMLDTGPTHAPKQLGAWLAALELPFAVRLYWLPKSASWLDQVEILFSQVPRALLTPNDFPSLVALEHDLMAYFAELNTHPQPIKWTYTKTQLLAKFQEPPLQLAA